MMNERAQGARWSSRLLLSFACGCRHRPAETYDGRCDCCELSEPERRPTGRFITKSFWQTVP